MITLKVKQLPSRYFLKDGKHHIEYFFQISEGVGYFTDIAVLWNSAVGTTEINFLNKAQTAISYVEESKHRANKFEENELDFVFKEVLVEGFIAQRKTSTPEKFKVKSY